MQVERFYLAEIPFGMSKPISLKYKVILTNLKKEGKVAQL